MKYLKRHYKYVFCEVIFALSIFSSQAAFASEAGAVKHLDNLSDPRNIKARGSSQPCASNIQKSQSGLLSTSGQASKQAQACLIKVDAAIDALAKGRVLIVDTRTASEFDKYRIPSSLNIPAHAIKTKSFLKSKEFFLVNASHTSADLENVCADLKRNGYSRALVLQGGLSLWKARGGVFEGDAIASRALSTVHPAEFIQTQSAKDWLVIDVRNRKNLDSKKNLPGAVSVPWSAKQKNDGALLAAINGAGSKRVLVIDESGDSYTGIEGMPGIRQKDVLYLEGGFSAYQKYQREQVAMWKQRDEPPKQKGCST